MKVVLPSVASFWLGSKLGFAEALCLTSFVKLGHETVLYAYGTPENLPEGVRLENAEPFGPLELAEKYARDGVIPAFADRFRYRMLAETDHIWVDTDMLGLRPIQSADYVFGTLKNHTRLVNNAVLRLPRRSSILQSLIDHTERYFPEVPKDWPYSKKYFGGANPSGARVVLPTREFSVGELPFYFGGPHALTYYLKKYSLLDWASQPDRFYPFDARLVARNTKWPDRFPLELPEVTEAVHHVGGRIFRKFAYAQDGKLSINSESFVGRYAAGIRFFATNPSDFFDLSP